MQLVNSFIFKRFSFITINRFLTCVANITEIKILKRKKKC